VNRQTVLALALVAACKVDSNPPGGGSGSVAVNPSAPAGSIELTKLPGYPADCPTNLVLDCDALVAADVRKELFDGASGTRTGDHACAWGTGDAAERIDVEPRIDARTNWIGRMKNRLRSVEALGRVAMIADGDVDFIPSKLDCEVRVHSPSLERAKTIAKAIDAGLSKASIGATVAR
jgi:hypothetical protein